MACYFSVREVKAYRITGGVKLVVTTDIPCQLVMRWSLIPPQAHTVPLLRRGLYMHGDRYYCFVAYHDNFQQEPRDTLTHSFIKVPWAVCETRYFHFWGKVGIEVCPSTSPCFQLHLEAEAPPQVHEYLACWHNRDLFSVNPTWATARNGYNPSKYKNYQRPTSELYVKTSGGYSILRAYQNFDTFALPGGAGAAIEEAELGLFITYLSGYHCDLCITKGLWNEPVTPGDFALQTNETTILGSMDTAGMLLDQYNWIPLNATGIAYINQRDTEINQHESYDWRQTAGLLFYPPYWRSQSFTPQTDHKIATIRLRMRRVGSPGTMNVDIYLADASHFPTGSPIASGLIDANTFTTAPDGDWYLVSLAGNPTLTAGTEYCVVLHIIGGDDSNYPEWRGATASEYPNGLHSLSSNYGGSWSAQAAQDGYFIEYEEAKVGGTKFCLRTLFDVNDSAPGAGTNYETHFYSAQAGAGFLPLLKLKLS
ncbi:hypothetical protein ES708_10287 [subsurface metagenome]